MNRQPSSSEWRRPPFQVRLLIAIAIVGAATVLSACTGDTDTDSAPEAVIARGGVLYQQHCASCHRADLSGDPNWRTPNEDGSYPPPPHDSSGHTWHHPDRVLVELIRDGSDLPQSRMPAFGDRLDDDDIQAILEFIKSHWGAQELEHQGQVTEQDRAQP